MLAARNGAFLIYTFLVHSTSFLLSKSSYNILFSKSSYKKQSKKILKLDFMMQQWACLQVIFAILMG